MKIEYRNSIEVKYCVDVFVAGGGPAGVAAAYVASKNGAKVFLAEKGEMFGGAATKARVPAFMRFSDGINFLAGDFGRLVFERLYGKDTDYTTIEYSIETEKLKTIYDDLVVESNAEFLFDATLLDVVSENGYAEYAILECKEDIFAVKAKIFVDSTGDGTLAVKCGADFFKGDKNGKMMPATLCSLWGDIDWSRAIVELGKDPDNRNLKKAFEDGVFTIKDPGLPGMWKLTDHYGGGNIGHVFGVDGTDGKSVTLGIIEARKRMQEYEYYYRNYLEGYENAKVITTAETLGIRETRRIECDYMLTMDDYFSFVDFEDEIGRYCYPVDIHPYEIGAKEETRGLYSKGYEKGHSYGIPYRSLIPKKLKNVLVSGRCIGAERGIMGSVRVMPCCFLTGSAAGAAAAICAKKESDVRQINIDELKKAIKLN